MVKNRVYAKIHTRKIKVYYSMWVPYARCSLKARSYEGYTGQRLYRRLLIGRDGHLDQSEAYDIS